MSHGADSGQHSGYGTYQYRSPVRAAPLWQDLKPYLHVSGEFAGPLSWHYLRAHRTIPLTRKALADMHFLIAATAS